MSSKTVEDIERVIGTLTPQELEKLYAWFEQYYSQLVDMQLKADLDAGRFDERIRRAVANKTSH